MNVRITKFERKITEIHRNKRIKEYGGVHIIRILEDGAEYCSACKGKCKIDDNDKDIIKMAIKAVKIIDDIV